MRTPRLSGYSGLSPGSSRLAGSAVRWLRAPPPARSPGPETGKSASFFHHWPPTLQAT